MAFQPLCVAENDSRRVEITYLNPNVATIWRKMPL